MSDYSLYFGIGWGGECYGFIPGASTELLLCDLFRNIDRHNVLKNYTLLVTIDIEGAYDGVCHGVLLNHLWRLGVPIYIISYLEAWLCNRRFRARFRTAGGNCVGDRFRFHTGLPQGGVLSPFLRILFTIFAAPQIREKCEARGVSVEISFFVFADDFTFTLSHSCIATLQSDAFIVAAVISGCFEELKLVISGDKSYCFLVNPFILGEAFRKSSRFHEGESRKVHHQSLEAARFASNWGSPGSRVLRDMAWPYTWKPSIKILGVIFTPSMAFEEHAEVVTTACQARMGVLRRIAGSSWGIGLPMAVSAYKALILTKISYAIAAFGPFMSPEDIRKIDISVVHIASRMVTGVGRSTRTEAHLMVSGLLQFRTLLLRRCALLLDSVFRNPRLDIYKNLLNSFPSLKNSEPEFQTPPISRAEILDIRWAPPQAWALSADSNLSPLLGPLGNTALVLAHTSEEPLRPVPSGDTYHSTLTSRAPELGSSAPPPAFRFTDNMGWVEMALVALDRLDWPNLAKPPGYRVSALGLNGDAIVTLQRFARSEAKVANEQVLLNMRDNSALTMGTDGSFVKRDGKLLSSLVLLPKDSRPYFQSTLEATGGDSYLAEILAIFRLFSLLVGENPHTAGRREDMNNLLKIGNIKKIFCYTDNLSALLKITGIFEFKITGRIKYHEFVVCRLINRVCTTYGVSIVFSHVHSHNGMWLNEVADSILGFHRRAIASLGNTLSSAHRAPLYPLRVKNDIKNLLIRDEEGFWSALGGDHGSISGQLHMTLHLNYKITKNVFKILYFDKKLQTIFSQFLTGSLFKRLENNVLINILCPKCKSQLLYWWHFYVCYGLFRAPGAFLRSENGLAEIAIAFHENREINVPASWAPEALLWRH